MKPLRQLCAIFVLLTALALPALAGDMQCGSVPPPPPPSASIISATPTDSTQTSGTATETNSIDIFAEFTFGILQSVMSLF